MGRLFLEELRKQIRHLNIVPGQFPALLALWQQDGQTQRELVEKLDVEQATLANTLKRMERDGLTRRKDHPTDRRAKIIFLTEKARSIRDEAYTAASSVNYTALTGFSPEECIQFVTFMQRIIQTLQKA